MSKIIILKPAPAIAPRGKQVGAFVDTKQEIGTDPKGEAYNHVIVVVQLRTTDKGGKPYQIEKIYNVLGRGIAAFSDDFKAWNQRELTQDEVEGFDPDTLIKGQKVVVEIGHRKVGKDIVANITGFHPAGVPDKGGFLLGSKTGDTITFHGEHEMQRPSLLLSRPGITSNVYAAFGTGVFEIAPTYAYHGWVVGYSIAYSSGTVAPDHTIEDAVNVSLGKCHKAASSAGDKTRSAVRHSCLGEADHVAS